MKDKIFSGFFGNCHCQGIAVDKKRGFIYYSFTTKLVKCDLDGTLIGTVDNVVGHLGCIDFNESDGRLYASLEYKNDAIGKGILGALGKTDELSVAFYIAIFDVDKIDRVGMDAERDGVMRTVFLRTVLDDYFGTAKIGGREYEHIHGCSGIDGITFGPDFGAPDGRRYLSVCYGIYSDVFRPDNDYQVILQYDADGWWDSVARPILQSDMHSSGPDAPRRKYFVFTGNTTYGVQNFEYDEYTGDYFMCVYRGKKPEFPNYPMYVIDGSRAAVESELLGCGEWGLVLALRDTGEGENGIYGINFPHGSTGFCSLGDGNFYVSEHFSAEEGQATNVYLYRLLREGGKWEFSRVE